MKKRFIILIGILFFSYPAKTQTKDSIRLLKQFVTVGKKYQSPPVQVSVTYKKTSNNIDNTNDSTSVRGRFVIQNQTNGYIDFGNTEQIISDSIVVVIAKDIKRMIVYSGSKEQMQKKMIPLGFMNYHDSAYKQLLERYSVRQIKDTGNIETIELTSRQLVFNTQTPKEVISMRFDAKTMQPLVMFTKKRNLKRYDETNSRNIDESKYQIVTVENRGKYWVYEEVESFELNTIQHIANIELPYKITDRIIKTPDNGFKPAKGFEGFNITTH